MAEHMELLGADYCEHLVFHPGCGVTRAVSVLAHVPKFSGKVDTSIRHVGNNQGHDMCIQASVETETDRVTWDNVLQELRQGKRVSVFATNPVRKAIIRSDVDL